MNRTTFLIVFFIVGVTIVYFLIRPKEGKLPVINPVDVEAEMVDSLMQGKGYGHKIGSFAFPNQNGDTISSSDVSGKVYVAEYFFTTCKSICPVMNQEMKRVNKVYADNDEVMILSFSVDPETDTVEQMKRYSDELGVIGNNWHFLTGDKSELYALARKSFFVLKPAEAKNLGDAGSDFMHTNNFVLVDREARIRGYYDGTNPEEVGKLINDIEKLLEE